MTSSATPPLSDDAFARIAAILYAHSGIVLAAHKKDMMVSRLAKRVRELGLGDFDAYEKMLQKNSEEIGFLVNAMTTNLTSFFRESHHFDHLRDTLLLPRLASRPQQKRLRLWSAGCSKGAEAYSMAMVLADCLSGQHGWDAKILATDIDTSMIDHGRSGLYASAEIRSVPTAYRRFVQSHSEKVQMSEALQAMVTFKPLNLLENWPMKGPFDGIFCRNVVIYFDKPTQRKLFARLRHMLAPDGFLYVGHSESLAQVSEDFKLVGKTIYRPC